MFNKKQLTIIEEMPELLRSTMDGTPGIGKVEPVSKSEPFNWKNYSEYSSELNNGLVEPFDWKNDPEYSSEAELTTPNTNGRARVIGYIGLSGSSRPSIVNDLQELPPELSAKADQA